MKDNYQIAVELNAEWKEIYNSREYNRGRSLSLLLESIRKCNFRVLYKIFRDKRAYKIIRKRYSFDINEVFCNYDSVDREKKILVYSCVLGDYDNFKQPVIKEGNVDYVMFSDNKNYEGGIWELHTIPDDILALGDKTLINRYIKMHPWELINKDYDYFIYLDGNVKMVGDIYSLVGNAEKSNVGIAMYTHKERCCVYDEAAVCNLYKKGRKTEINNQIKRYKENGFPTKFGMCEATIVVSDSNNCTSKKIFEEWWNEFYNSNSNRDQLSLPYVLWKNDYKLEDVGVLGNNILEDNRVRIYKHHIKV